jgi:hypothetical protein
MKLKNISKPTMTTSTKLPPTPMRKAAQIPRMGAKEMQEEFKESKTPAVKPVKMGKSTTMKETKLK